MAAFRKNPGRSTLLAVAAIFTILMMGTSPMVRAFSGTAYTPVFSRTSCGDLGTYIQARFGWDASNNGTDSMAINEIGSGDIHHVNGTGDFKFDQAAEGLPYLANVSGGEYWPSIEAYAYFHGYKIDSVNMTMSEPVSGTSYASTTYMRNESASYNLNFSSAGDEFHITISQSSTDVVATFSIVDPNANTLQSWTLDQSLSGLNTPPPYPSYSVNAELNGLEKDGLATLRSGTDFQIESVIHPYTVTDFTGHAVQGYTQSQWISGPCQAWYADDEGNAGTTYTYGTSGTGSSSNEAWQYYKVT